MIKGIVNGVEKDIIRIPMKGKQVYDSAHSTAYAAVLDANNMWVNASTAKSIKIRVEPSTQYTLSIDSPNNSIFRICESDDADITPQSASSAVELTRIVRDTTIKQYTFTTSDSAQCIIFQGSSTSYEQWNSTLMLNLGSTALPYEPYGYQEGWEVRKGDGTLVWGRNDTISVNSGTLPVKGYGVPLKSGELDGNMTQTGTPTPDAPIMPQGCGNLVESGEHAGQYAVPISCGGQTTPIYLGQTPTVRRIKKLVLTGKESWSKASSYPVFITSLGTAPNSSRAITTASTHYSAQENTDGTRLVNDNSVAIRLSYSTLYIGDSRYENATDFKAYLAAQYAAGTPVTVWYVLATPETAIVNEPLMKIGTYADTLTVTDQDVTITPAVGNDTITVDTTLPPSKFTVVGHVRDRST